MARRHDALIPLSHDHQQALALAFRLQHPAPPGPATPTTPASTRESRKAETLAFFDEHLLAHFAIEEEILFPALRRAYGAATPEQALVSELCADHVRLRALRDAIDRATGAAALDQALDAFADLLGRHVRLEERGLFVQFPGALDERAVAELQREIHARRPPDTPGTCKVR